MLQKTKRFASKFGKKTLELAKRNIPATVSLVLTVAAIILTTVCSAHTVSIYDGRSSYSVLTLSANPEVILSKVNLAKEDYEVVSFKNGIFAGKIEIAYLVPLTVKKGDEVKTYVVREGRLSNLLADAGIDLDEHDIVSLSLNYYVDKATEVEITDVEFVTVITTENVPSESKESVKTKTITTCVKYVNGVATEVVSTSEKISSYTIEQNTIEETKTPQYSANASYPASSVPCISTLDAPDSLLLDKSGKPIEYVSKTTLRATAYTHTGNRCSTGVYPQPGCVAVDPKEIPYGTKMYIVSADGKYVYGYAIAADTGGFINGTRTDIDLFLDTESQCKEFGRRDVVVYFVK